jgi:hypothetical protein
MQIQVLQGPQLSVASGLQIPAGASLSPEWSRKDSLVYPQELTQVLNKPRAELYRPRKWRGYIPVEGVASWAQRIEDRKYNTKIENPILASNKGPTQEIPTPSFTTSNQFLSVYEFLLGYGYTDRDVELAAKLGENLSAQNVEACNDAFEYYLETIASVGDTSNGVTMKGLSNLADTTTAVAVTKAATGTTWAVATAAEIVQDLCTAALAVETATKENRKCNQILVPLAQYQKALTTFTTQNESTALDLFRRIMPGVQVETWNAVGSGVLMAYDTSNPYGPRMLMQKEATSLTPLRGINGWFVPMKMATGGVRAIDPTSVVKMTGL